MFRLLILLLAIQDQPVQGPVSDAIEKRLQEILQRSEERQAEATKVYSARFDEILKSLKEARDEREEMQKSLLTFKTEREGLIGKLVEVRIVQDGILGRLAGIHTRFESIDQRWTPIQNLVDRVTNLVWKLIWMIVSLFILTIAVVAAGLFLYVRLKSKLLLLAKG